MDADLFQTSLLIVVFIYTCCAILYVIKTGISDSTKSTTKFCIVVLMFLISVFVVPTAVVYFILKYIIY